MRGLQAFDDFLRQRHGNLGAAGDQSLKGSLVQPHQDAIAHRDHRGRTWLVGVQAHLTEGLTACDFAQHPLLPVVAARIHPQAPADGQIHGIARVTLRYQGLACRQFNPFKMALQHRHGRWIQFPQDIRQHSGQQSVMVVLHGIARGGGLEADCRVRLSGLWVADLGPHKDAQPLKPRIKPCIHTFFSAENGAMQKLPNSLPINSQASNQLSA